MLKMDKTNKGLMPVFNDWVENFFGRDSEDMFPTFGLFNKTTPAVNIFETPENFMLELGVPGMKREDFNVEIDNGVLFISCEKEVNKEEKDKRWTRREFNYQMFKRSFMLPENVKVDKINAIYENGMLKVKLPKEKVTKKDVRKVKIEGA